MLKYFFLLITTFFLSAVLLHAQGTLLIVGGGSESNDAPSSWSTVAYTWAVAQSENKKVAVIHYDNTGDWLRPYFISHCGAADSKNFVINASNANNAGLMEELSGYDMFFFRGGDQYEYYNDYRGSLMEETMQSKFDEGGVLAGTSAGLAILSEILFPATNGSAYSDIAVKNINHSSMVLADDFLSVAPDMIFDSHFINRGRMGRLIAFMAHYEKDKGTRIRGIGVDETTAFGLKPSNTGIAFGTGAVHIYDLPEAYNFGSGPGLSFRNMRYTSLVHLDSIDLKTGKVWGMDQSSNPQESGSYDGQNLYISGSAELSPATLSMIKDFTHAGKGASDSILILSGNPDGIASGVKSVLEAEGAGWVNIIDAVFSSSDDASLTPLIRNARKIFFTGNNTYNLNVYLASGTNGPLTAEKIRNPETILGFMGDDSRYAGEWTVTNYFSSNGSSGGTFSLSEGFASLPDFCIIPRTYDPPSGSTDNWESTQAALPWAMVQKEVKNGIWLNNDNYVVVAPSGGKLSVQAKGSSPVMFLRQSAPGTGKVSMTYNGQAGETPRMIAAFEEMHLSSLVEGESFIPGVTTSIPKVLEPIPDFRVFPNPVSQTLRIESAVSLSRVRVLNLNGQPIREIQKNSATFTFDVGSLEPGIYFVEGRTHQQVLRKKFIKTD